MRNFHRLGITGFTLATSIWAKRLADGIDWHFLDELKWELKA
jgi:hypothetical protein